MGDQHSLPAVVCGHMLGVPLEADSSGGSSEDTLEEREKPNQPPTSSAVELFTNDLVEPERNKGGLGEVGLFDSTEVTLDLPPPPEHPQHSVNSSWGVEAPEKNTAGARLNTKPIGNAFGIAYRSYGTSKQGYSLPSGPAFEDEDEFDQQMGAEFRFVTGPTAGDKVLPPVISGTKETESENNVDFEQGTDTGTLLDKGVHGVVSAQSPYDFQAKKVLRKNDGFFSETNVSSKSRLINIDDIVDLKPHQEIQKDNAKALKELMEEYRQAGSALQKPVDNVKALGDSANTIGKQSVDIKANDAGFTVDIDRDVPRCPVIKEEKEEEALGFRDQSKKASGKDTNQKIKREGGIEDEECPRTRVAKEWESIEQLRNAECSVPMEKGVGDSLQPVGFDERDCIVSAMEALRYFLSQDLSVHKEDIVPFQQNKTRIGLFRRVPTLNFSGGEHLRDEVFLIAKIHYTPNDVMHRRLIQTIYRRMKHEQRACPDLGPHWDTIGFQGTDPRTDLNRSMGVFSLLQVLHFVETKPAFAAMLYRVSTANVTGWPFLCVSIGFTKEAVGILRQGACFTECNRRRTVMEVVHELHQAQFHAFLVLCRNEPATHHALHLSEVRKMIEADSSALVKAYRAYLADEKTKLETVVIEKTSKAVEHKLLNFARGKVEHDGDSRLRVELGSRKHPYITNSAPEGASTLRRRDLTEL